MTDRSHIVICIADHSTDRYEAATRTLFTAEEAAKYASGMHQNLRPRVVTPVEFLKIAGWRDASERPELKL
jgi:hypothetical protein